MLYLSLYIIGTTLLQSFRSFRSFVHSFVRLFILSLHPPSQLPPIQINIMNFPPCPPPRSLTLRVVTYNVIEKMAYHLGVIQSIIHGKIQKLNNKIRINIIPTDPLNASQNESSVFPQNELRPQPKIKNPRKPREQPTLKKNVNHDQFNEKRIISSSSLFPKKKKRITLQRAILEIRSFCGQVFFFFCLNSILQHFKYF